MRTLAALPVGASSSQSAPCYRTVFTTAAINCVLPVPAYPRNKKTE
ncbi:hypothetical protein [Porphyromonas loveana]